MTTWIRNNFPHQSILSSFLQNWQHWTLKIGTLRLGIAFQFLTERKPSVLVRSSSIFQPGKTKSHLPKHTHTKQRPNKKHISKSDKKYFKYCYSPKFSNPLLLPLWLLLCETLVSICLSFTLKLHVLLRIMFSKHFLLKLKKESKQINQVKSKQREL